MELVLPNGERVILHSPMGGGYTYDPTKAHEYYMRTRQLKGRARGQAQPPAAPNRAKQQQKQELSARIVGLEKKLTELDDLIKIKEAALKRSQEVLKNRKLHPTAADKAKAARDSKQYRQKHKTELAAKAKAADKNAGGATPDRQKSIKDLKMLSTKVRGQLQAAKAKLAAL